MIHPYGIVNLSDYLICPELYKGCQSIEDQGDYLLCTCGKKYYKINDYQL